MDNQEAIEIIRDIDKAYRTFTKTEIQALEMAIEALEQDSRKITLEDVKGYCKSRCLTIITNELLYELTHSKIKAIEQEPSSDLISRQAVIDTLKGIEILHSNDNLRKALIDMLYELPPINLQPCENVISRQATIEAFQMFRGYEANRTNAEWVDRIETVVKKLPPVNLQDLKTGHPNCGVKMGGGVE